MTGHPPRRRIIAALTTLLLLAGALASATAIARGHGGPARPRCPKGSLVVTHPRGCLPIQPVQAGLAPQLPSPTRAGRIVAATLYPRDQLRLYGRDLAARTSVDRSAIGVGERLILAAEHGPPIQTSILTARAAHGGLAGEHPTPPARAAAAPLDIKVSDGHGLEASGTAQTFEPPAGESGGGLGFITRLEKTVEGASGFLSQSVSMSGFAESCPDAAGKVHGTGFAHGGVSIGFNEPGKAGEEGTVSIDGKATFVGQVDAQAQLTDFDMVYDATYSYDGPAPGLLGIAIGQAHQRGELHMVFRHLHVGAPINGDDWVSQLSGSRTSGFGPAGVLSGMYKNAVEGMGSLAQVIKSEEDRALQDAQRNWDQNHECLKTNFDPSSLANVARGSTHPVSVSVTDARAGEPPVKMPVTLNAYPADGGASVTPTSAETGRTPTELQLTVSGKQGDTTTLVVRGVSDRGRLYGSMTATTGNTLTLSSNRSGTFNYSSSSEQDSGSYSEGVQASIPIPSGGGGSGSLSWTQLHFHLQKYYPDGTGQCTNPAGDPTNDTADGSGPQPGAVTITQITGNPNVSVTLSVADPSFDTHDVYVSQSGCGNSTSDTPTSIDPGFQDAAGSQGVTTPGQNVFKITGWTPGAAGSGIAASKTIQLSDGTLTLRIVGSLG